MSVSATTASALIAAPDPTMITTVLGVVAIVFILQQKKVDLKAPFGFHVQWE